MLSISFFTRMTLGVCLSLTLAGCGGTAQQTAGDTRYASSPGYETQFGAPIGGARVGGPGAVSVAQGQILKAQADHDQKVWLTVQAPVLRNLEDDRKPPCHQR